MYWSGSELQKSEADFAAAGLGEGVLLLTHILNAPEEMGNHGRIFAHASLPVGAWVGPHTHDGESEIYYYLKGQGEYIDNGRTIPVRPGDVTRVASGQAHGLKNIGDIPLEYICLILNEDTCGEQK